VNDIRIQRVRGGQGNEGVVRELAELLLDAVASNAGISFMSDLTREGAEGWWRSVMRDASPRTVILVARDQQGVVGTVQIQPAWAPNQPHRGDVAKMMVHRRARGRGIARALMQELEHFARVEKYTLLLLDTVKDGAAEKLYASMGWTRVGEVPNFALNPDGSPAATVFYYKEFPA
jgi:GNAT superfamily N-acetyltransferase